MRKGNIYREQLARKQNARLQIFFAVLAAAKFTRDEVVFVDIAFADLDDLDEVNSLFIELFDEGQRPARTIYQAAALPFGGKVKVTGTAVKD